MNASVVERQRWFFFRILLRHWLIISDVLDRRLQAVDDRREKRHLPETHLGLLQPHHIVFCDSHSVSGLA
jgi:hypothetical protein